MEFLIGAVVVVVVIWMLIHLSGKRGKDDGAAATTVDTHPKPAHRIPHTLVATPYDSIQDLPTDLRDITQEIQRIDQLGRDPAREERREQIKEIEYELRSKHRLRWNGKDAGPLPLKALTETQRCILSYAAGLYVIQIQGGETIEINRNVLVAAKKSVERLVAHGFLKADQYGAFRITQSGLQALATLPTKSQ